MPKPGEPPRASANHDAILDDATLADNERAALIGELRERDPAAWFALATELLRQDAKRIEKVRWMRANNARLSQRNLPRRREKQRLAIEHRRRERAP